MVTKPKRDNKKNSKKKHTDIPLANLPDQLSRKGYTPEFKKEAVERLKGASAEQVAREMNISSSSLIHKWKQTLDAGLPLTQRGVPHAGRDPAALLRAEIERARAAKDERLETAAMIVESEGHKTAFDIAKRIRSLKGKTPT